MSVFRPGRTTDWATAHGDWLGGNSSPSCGSLRALAAPAAKHAAGLFGGFAKTRNAALAESPAIALPGFVPSTDDSRAARDRGGLFVTMTCAENGQHEDSLRALTDYTAPVGAHDSRAEYASAVRGRGGTRCPKR